MPITIPSETPPCIPLWGQRMAFVTNAQTAISRRMRSGCVSSTLERLSRCLNGRGAIPAPCCFAPPEGAHTKKEAAATSLFSKAGEGAAINSCQ